MTKRKDYKQKTTYIYYIESRGKYKVQIDRVGYKIKSKVFGTLKEAKIYRDQCLSSISDNSASVGNSNKIETLNETINYYLNNVSKKRRSLRSQENENYTYKRLIREETDLTNKITSDITEVDINNYITRRLDKKIKPNTILREMTFWKSFFDYSRQRLKLSDNPIAKANIKHLRINDARKNRISTDEKARLLKECYCSQNEILGPLIEFYFESGVRRGEALKLKFSDIKWHSDEYAIATLRDRKNSRNPHDQIHTDIPLNKQATEIIKKLYKQNDDSYIFCISEYALRSAYQRARKRAKLPKFRIHDMRHDRASTLANKGFQAHQIMAVTGHTDIRSVTRYINISAIETLETFQKHDM